MPRRDYSNTYNNSSYGYDNYSSGGGGGGNRSRGGGYDYDYQGYYPDSSSSGYGTTTSMSNFGTGGGGISGGFANFDKLQEQLSLRESQLAMASNLLEQQSRLIADVSTIDTRDRRTSGDRRNFGGYDRKRSGPDYRMNDNKRRRADSGSYGDDRRDNRRGYGGRQGGDMSRSPRAFMGGRQGQGRQGNNRQGGDRGRGQMSQRFRDNRRMGGGRGGGGGGGNNSMNKMKRPQGNRRNSQGDKPRTPKPKIVPRVSKELSRHYCHICEVECFNERNYQNHLSGTRHKEKADELDDNPTRKAEVEARMKKQEEERAKPVPVKESVDHCDICDLDIHVSLASHLKFKQHRHRETQVKRGCAWCNVGGFSNFSEVLAHRLTDQHKQMREQFGGRMRSDTIPKPEYVEEEEIPAFQEDTALGTDYVVPVTGFFCKLCNKFYKKEEAAKKNHCSSESHYDKWKQAKIDAISEYKVKLAEQKEREEAARLRIEEQAKQREEEAKTKAEAENGGETEEKMDTDGDAAQTEDATEDQKTDAETMETEGTEGVKTEETEAVEETPQNEEAEEAEPQENAEPVPEEEEEKLLAKTEEEEGGEGEGEGEAEEWAAEPEVEAPTTPTRRGKRAGRGARGRAARGKK